MFLLVYQNQQEDFGFGVGLLVMLVDGWMMVLVTLILVILVMSYSVALLVLGRLAMPSALVRVGGGAVLALHHVGHAPGALKARGSEVGGDED